MKLRTLIVDDEPLAREGLELALQDARDVDILGSCPDGPSAVREIRALKPDLVLLDIRMPGLSGFEVIDAISPEHMPVVIFLTAYEEYALRAFRVHAIDYLLKPVDAEALRDSLERARRRIAQDDILRRSEQLRSLLDGLARERPADDAFARIVVRASGRVYVLDPGDVTWVEASGDYVTVHTPAKAHLVRDSMKNMEARLSEHGFLRIHRSCLVNVRCVQELVAQDNGDHRVVLRDGTVLRASRNHRDALYAALNAAS